MHCLFFITWDVFSFADKTTSLKKVFHLAKEWEVKAAATTSLTRASTSPPIKYDIHATIEIPSVSSG